MSELYDYFVCSQSLIERWVDALEEQDEDLQEQIESEMPGFVTLKHVGPEDIIILTRCVEGDDVDTVTAVDDVDLLKAISEEQGPWFMSFRQPAVQAMAKMVVNESLIERWVKAAAEFNGIDEDWCRETLTADAAESLKEICEFAVENRNRVFNCSYG